ncbi:MAG: hypothetical protein K0V04_45175 [Deltaproteobacteria bacterium]|nr:hypothetical protein [Deltaproteobacteria bacterium]
MSRLIRTLISLSFLAGSLWFAFSVKLGDRTFAEHVDRIGQTPEARELINGTRSTVNPVLQEATDRMLGEHIEAPIRADTKASTTQGATHAATHDGAIASPSTANDHRLPGRG